MNDLYSPHTGEHIQTDTPADWMGRAGVAVPAYTQPDQSAFYRNGAWEIVANIVVSALAQAQAPQIATLSAACAAYIYAGFTSTALGAAYTYPSSDKDQANLSASVVASILPGVTAAWTTPFWCADSTGVWALRSHTAAQIQQVGMDGKNTILAAITQNATLAAKVGAATTAASVAAVVWVNP